MSEADGAIGPDAGAIGTAMPLDIRHADELVVRHGSAVEPHDASNATHRRYRFLATTV